LSVNQAGRCKYSNVWSGGPVSFLKVEQMVDVIVVCGTLETVDRAALRDRAAVNLKNPGYGGRTNLGVKVHKVGDVVALDAGRARDLVAKVSCGLSTRGCRNDQRNGSEGHDPGRHRHVADALRCRLFVSVI
jgi:hypothetical protein